MSRTDEERQKGLFRIFRQLKLYGLSDLQALVIMDLFHDYILILVRDATTEAAAALALEEFLRTRKGNDA